MASATVGIREPLCSDCQQSASSEPTGTDRGLNALISASGGLLAIQSLQRCVGRLSGQLSAFPWSAGLNLEISEGGSRET